LSVKHFQTCSLNVSITPKGDSIHPTHSMEAMQAYAGAKPRVT
jgi:hypothetical protein